MKRRHFLWYTLLWVAGCTASTQTRSAKTSGVNAPEKLRFAVTDAIGTEALERDYGKFRQVLQEVLAIPVEFFPVNNMPGAASALQLNQVDLALTGPSEYVVIRSRTNAVPVIAITRPNYRSVIVVPDRSNIKSIADLKNKTIALSDVGSTSGHLGPTNILIDAGLNPQSDITIKMLGDEGSVAALKAGEVEAWGGSALDRSTYFPDADSTEAKWRTIAEGSLLPSDVFVVNSQLDSEYVATLRSQLTDNQALLLQALASGEKTHKYKGSQLIPADDADYNMIREVYKAIGQGDFLQ